MDSATALTYEITDMKAAAKGLADEIKAQITLKKSSCGILFYDLEIDGTTLSQYLSEELPIALIGGTTVGVMTSRHGYQDLSASLLVMTADDCEFLTGSVLIDRNRPMPEVFRESYENTLQKAKAPVRMMYAIAPYLPDYDFAVQFKRLSEITGHIPVFGGLAGGVENRFVLANHRASAEQCAFILITGNVRPVLALGNTVTRIFDRQHKITGSAGAVVYEMDGGSRFLDVLKSYGFDEKAEDPHATSAFYQKYPFLVTDAAGEHKGFPYIRSIADVNREDGSGKMYVSLPENAQVSLMEMNKDDILRSAKESFSQLLENMHQEAGYRYSTILCVSCQMRHFTMNPHYGAETEAVQQMLPEELSLFGFYGASELCPVSLSGGKAKNQVHNCSIAFLTL